MLPKNTSTNLGLVCNYNGTNIKGYTDTYMNKSGSITYRGNNTYGDSMKSLLIKNEYILDN